MGQARARRSGAADAEYEIEVRQIFFETEDFDEEFTPELRAQEDRLRQEIADKK